MQVVFHMGAHMTDEDRIVRTLALNFRILRRQGVIVPHPQRYRMVLRDALIALRGAPSDAATQDTILAACSDQDTVNRLIFSHEFFLCVPDRVITPQGFYTMVPSKLRPLANLFPEDETEFHVALVNPATLIPQLVASQPKRTYREIMCDHDPREMRWAPVIREMVEAAEGRRIVLWCNEDLPMIWPEVIRSVAGLPAEFDLRGDDEILEQIMLPEGLDRLRAYIGSHPPQTVAQRRKIHAAFLDKFVRPEEVEIDADLPYWSEELIDDMTALYDLDVAEIAEMEGVTFIAP
ncbi:MAG: hypothetical protein R3D78_05355 [Paracoccaceae bacterium]